MNRMLNLVGKLVVFCAMIQPTIGQCAVAFCNASHTSFPQCDGTCTPCAVLYDEATLNAKIASCPSNTYYNCDRDSCLSCMFPNDETVTNYCYAQYNVTVDPGCVSGWDCDGIAYLFPVLHSCQHLQGPICQTPMQMCQEYQSRNLNRGYYLDAPYTFRDCKRCPSCYPGYNVNPCWNGTGPGLCSDGCWPCDQLNYIRTYDKCETTAESECTRCATGKYELNRQCVNCAECPLGEIRWDCNKNNGADGGGHCVSCPPSTYKPEYSDSCLDCPVCRFGLSQEPLTQIVVNCGGGDWGECKFCPEGTYILSFNDDTWQDERTALGYPATFLNATCMPCPVCDSNLTRVDCSGENSGFCRNCPWGQGLLNGQCQPCSSGCKDCQDGNCLQCFLATDFVFNNECVRCPDSSLTSDAVNASTVLTAVSSLPQCTCSGSRSLYWTGSELTCSCPAGFYDDGTCRSCQCPDIDGRSWSRFLCVGRHFSQCESHRAKCNIHCNASHRPWPPVQYPECNSSCTACTELFDAVTLEQKKNSCPSRTYYDCNSDSCLSCGYDLSELSLWNAYKSGLDYFYLLYNWNMSFDYCTYNGLVNYTSGALDDKAIQLESCNALEGPICAPKLTSCQILTASDCFSGSPPSGLNDVQELAHLLREKVDLALVNCSLHEWYLDGSCKQCHSDGEVCPSGFYKKDCGLLTGAGYCESCSRRCKPGQGVTNCGNVLVGRNSNNPGSCTTCPAYTYALNSTCVDCLPCPAGFMRHNCKNTSAGECLPCPAGTFSNENNLVPCRDCNYCRYSSPGTVADGCGPSSPSTCAMCQDGKYRIVGKGLLSPDSNLTETELFLADTANILILRYHSANNYAYEYWQEDSADVCRDCDSCPDGFWRSNCQGDNPGTCEVCEPCSEGYTRVGCQGRSSGVCFLDLCEPCDDGQVRLDNIACSECITIQAARQPYEFENPQCDEPVKDIVDDLLFPRRGGFTFEQIYGSNPQFQCSEQCDGTTLTDSVTCDGPFACGKRSCLSESSDSIPFACPYEITPAEFDNPWQFAESLAVKLAAQCQSCETCGSFGEGRGCARECSQILCSENFVFDWTDKQCKSCSDLSNPRLCGNNFHDRHVSGNHPRFFFDSCKGSPFDATYGSCKSCSELMCEMFDQFPAHGCSCRNCARSNVRKLTFRDRQLHCQLSLCPLGRTGVNPEGQLCEEYCRNDIICDSGERLQQCTMNQQSKCVPLHPLDFTDRQPKSFIQTNLFGLAGSFENVLVDEKADNGDKYQCVYNSRLTGINDANPAQISDKFLPATVSSIYPEGSKLCKYVDKQIVRPLLPLQNTFQEGSLHFVSIDCPARVASYDYTGDGKQIVPHIRKAQRPFSYFGSFYLIVEMRNVHNATLEFDIARSLELWPWPLYLTFSTLLLDEITDVSTQVRLVTDKIAWWWRSPIDLQLLSDLEFSTEDFLPAPGFLLQPSIVRGSRFLYSDREISNSCLQTCSCPSVCSDLCALRCLSQVSVQAEPFLTVPIFNFQQHVIFHTLHTAITHKKAIFGLASDRLVDLLLYRILPDGSYTFGWITWPANQLNEGMPKITSLVLFEDEQQNEIVAAYSKWNSLWAWHAFTIQEGALTSLQIVVPDSRNIMTASSLGLALYIFELASSLQETTTLTFQLRRHFMYTNWNSQHDANAIEADSMSIIDKLQLPTVDQCTMKSTFEYQREVHAIACWTQTNLYLMLCTSYNCLYEGRGEQVRVANHDGSPVWLSWLQHTTLEFAFGDAFVVTQHNAWLIGTDDLVSFQVRAVSSPLQHRKVLAYETSMVSFDNNVANLQVFLRHFRLGENEEAFASTAIAILPMQHKPAAHMHANGQRHAVAMSLDGLKHAFLQEADRQGQLASVDFVEVDFDKSYRFPFNPVTYIRINERVDANNIQVILHVQDKLCYNLGVSGVLSSTTTITGPATGVVNSGAVTLTGSWSVRLQPDCVNHNFTVSQEWKHHSYFVKANTPVVRLLFSSEDDAAVGVDNVQLVPTFESTKIAQNLFSVQIPTLQMLRDLDLQETQTNIHSTTGWPRQHVFVMCEQESNINVTLQGSNAGCVAENNFPCALELPVNALTNYSTTLVANCQQLIVLPSSQPYECIGHTYFSVAASSCQPCGFSCPSGYRDIDCAALGVSRCAVCENLPQNATWGPMCSVECVSGFFLFDNKCAICNPAPASCPPGFRPANCTANHDAHCAKCDNIIDSELEMFTYGCQTACKLNAFASTQGGCVRCSSLEQLKARVEIQRSEGIMTNNFVRFWPCTSTADARYEECANPAYGVTYIGDGLSFSHNCLIRCANGLQEEAGACKPCLNTPKSDPSTYIAKFNCSFTCAQDYYRRGSACIKCKTSECIAGTYLSNCTVCKNCSNLKPGFVWTGHGKLDDPDSCPSECGPGTFLQFGYGVCVPHSNPVCKNDEYMLLPSAFRDAKCTKCSTCEGKRLQQPCSNVSDAVCASCGEAPAHAMWVGVNQVSGHCSLTCLQGFTLNRGLQLCEFCDVTCPLGTFRPEILDNCTHCLQCPLPETVGRNQIVWHGNCLWTCLPGYEFVNNTCQATSANAPEMSTFGRVVQILSCPRGKYLTILGCTSCNVTVPVNRTTWQWKVPGAACEWQCLNGMVKHFHQNIVKCRSFDASLNLHLLNGGSPVPSMARRSFRSTAVADQESSDQTLLWVLISLSALVLLMIVLAAFSNGK